MAGVFTDCALILGVLACIHTSDPIMLGTVLVLSKTTQTRGNIYIYIYIYIYIWYNNQMRGKKISIMPTVGDRRLYRVLYV